MIYELREYTTVPGRMPDLIRRFQDHVFAGFDRHGIESVLTAQTAIGSNIVEELVFVQRFESYQDMDEKWTAFIADPVWQAARIESEKDAPMLTTASRRILDPSAFR